MANYIKSFNFRNGVQVDNNHFIVNANGLVGIGSTVPTQVLDVVGNINVSGFVTAPNLYTTLLSAPAASITTVTAGVVTANYFYGDGQNIINIPTSQWVNIDVGLGFTSIYARGYVGIATVDPRFTLQVGGNPNNSQSGVGINSTGSILATGIITASSFSGSGSSITNINASNINTGTLGNSYLPSSISVSGIITAGQYFSGNLVGNITGIASTALTLSGTPSISVSNITANSYYSTGILTSSTINATSIVTTSINLTSLNVGTSGTIFNVTNFGGVGIGTSLPTSDLQIRKSNATLLEVLSDTSSSTISIGQSVGVGKSTAVLRFGTSAKTFDIINNDTGSIRTILHNGSSGISTGKFSWIYGQTGEELMALTYDGKLTVPGNINLSSGIGSVTIGNKLYLNSDLAVTGSITGTINYPSIFTNSNLNNNTGITTLLKLNVTSNIGINSSNPIVGLDGQSATALFSGIGINTNNISNASLIVNGFSQLGTVGIGTTTIYNVPNQGNSGAFQVHNNAITVFNGSILVDDKSRLGFGTFIPRSIIDYGNVGSSATTGYMITPTVTTPQRVGFAYTIEGAIIYNSTLKRHQGYGSTNGGATFDWQNLY